MGFCLALASHALIFTDEKNSEKKKIVVGPRHKMTETFLCFFPHFFGSSVVTTNHPSLSLARTYPSRTEDCTLPRSARE